MGEILPQQKVKTMELLRIPTKEELRDNQKRIDGIKKSTKKKVKKKKRKPRKTIRSYKTYMQSPLWEKRKNRYWQKYKKICEACGKKKYVTLHHQIYNNNYGDEPDDEVTALCHECHHNFHEFYGCKKDMRKETEEFLTEMWSIKNGLQEMRDYEYKFKAGHYKK